jgi:hypothetical protein
VLTLVRPRSSPKLPELPWDGATVGGNGNSNGNGDGNGNGDETPGPPRVELGP